MPPPAPLEFPAPDDALVAPLRAGDETAWRRAYAELWPVAWRAAQAVLRQPHDSEDVAMLALQKLYAHRDRPRCWNDFLALAAVIARREAISAQRARDAGKRGGGNVVSLDELAHEPAALPETIAVGLDLAELLAGLSPEVRRIVEAHFIEGRNSREIAERIGGNASTVRSHLLRALDVLRRRHVPAATAAARPARSESVP